MFKNAFIKGLQKDFDKYLVQPDQYVDAKDITLTQDGKFLSAVNIAGTDEISTIFETAEEGFKLMGLFATRYKINDNPRTRCLTIFTVDEENGYQIICYDLENNFSYLLYQEAYTSDMSREDVLVDLVVFAEDGIDSIYFTDNLGELRKIICEIGNTFVNSNGYAVQFSSEELSLQRRGTRGNLTITAESGSSSLLCGNYQVVYRAWNNNTNRYSKWSPLSRLINVFLNQGNDKFDTGGVGQISNNVYLNFSVTLSDEEQNLYTHVQFGVIEHVLPTPTTTVALLEPIIVPSASATVTYDYKSNHRGRTVTIDEITIDDAAIETVKTLIAKDNYLIGGNVKYRGLDFDVPTVTGEIDYIFDGDGAFYNDPSNQSRLGYFSGETYRFGIVYFDQYGNRSPVKVLNMTNIGGNTASTGIDFKFPDRSTQAGSIWNFGAIRIKGLDLSINNHPTWAVGYEIVRVKRTGNLKRIQWQTPLIPCSNILGSRVAGSYPTEYYEWDGTTENTVSSPEGTQPMNPLGTHVPKNFFHTELRNTTKRVFSQVTGDISSPATTDFNSVRWEPPVISTTDMYVVASPNSFIEDNYVFNVGDEFKVVDVAFLKLDYTEFTEPPYKTYTKGDTIGTNIGGTFYATTYVDYYNDGFTLRDKPPRTDDSGVIDDYAEIQNFGEGTVVGGKIFGRFSNLETQGLQLGVKPNNQRLAVIKIDSPRQDVTQLTNTTSQLSVLGGTIPSGFFWGGEGENSIANPNNKFVIAKGNFEPNDTEELKKYVSSVEIVNIIKNVGDDRYGGVDEQHEFISTGANYFFTDAQLIDVRAGNQVVTNLKVYGGDCYTSLLNLKITDSHYGITLATNEGDNATLRRRSVAEKWTKAFKETLTILNVSTKDAPIRMPVAYEGLSQVISVVIESEVNVDVLDVQPLNPVGGSTFKRPTHENVGQIRVPFSYRYNQNLSKQNDLRVGFTKPEYVVEKNEFRSRLIYSDPKILQTDEEGFDRFRVGNIFDLDETFGGITKLVFGGDNLFAVKERGVSYIPVQANIIETDDAATMQIRSSEVIAREKVVSTLYGSQHIKSVVPFDTGFFFTDVLNKVIIRMAEGADLMSEKGMVTEFNNLLDTNIREDQLNAIYDINRKQYILTSRSNKPFTWVYDDRVGGWVSSYSFDSDHELLDGVFFDKKLLIVGKKSDIKLYSMYTNATSQLMGKNLTPEIKFIVNGESEIAKTFDNILIYSSDRLGEFDIRVEREGLLGDQLSNNLDIDVDPREGNYRIKILRDQDGARMRGHFAEATIRWKTADNKRVKLSTVVTKYRLSDRKI